MRLKARLVVDLEYDVPMDEYEDGATIKEVIEGEKRLAQRNPAGFFLVQQEGDRQRITVTIKESGGVEA